MNKKLLKELKEVVDEMFENSETTFYTDLKDLPEEEKTTDIIELIETFDKDDEVFYKYFKEKYFPKLSNEEYWNTMMEYLSKLCDRVSDEGDTIELTRVLKLFEED